MDQHQAWHRDVLLKKTAQALEKNNFTVQVARNAADALEKILAVVQPGDSVAFGGSQTVKALGVEGALAARGQKLMTPPPGASFEETLQLRRQALLSDVYIASPNAVTADGTLVFVDKIGNRAAGMMFGPKTVVAVAGFNKIAASETAAFERMDTVAAPTNAHRLALNTPCAVTGICTDCNSPQRICNISVTLWKRPAYTNYLVILLPESLGY